MDYWRGTLSPRRLAVLVEHLPPSSATKRALAGESADWGVAEHLLAFVADLLAAGNWQRSGDPKAPKPKPLPRPGVGVETRRPRARRRSSSEVRAALARHYRKE